MREQLLDASRVERAILSYDSAMLMPALPNSHLAREVIRAANDWSVDRWLSGKDDRLYGLILVPNQVPDDAAAEVRRVGKNPRMVGVLLGENGVGKLFGHPVYHPIYEAAVELGLPVVLHVGSDAVPDTQTATSAGGLPVTYADYRILAAQPLMAHLVSFIGQGVFEKYPDLRLFVVGIGASWIPGLMWRFDTNYKTLRREVPWVTRIPSEYLRSNVRISTYPLDRTPKPEQLVRILNAYGGAEDLLCFASGYPDWDANDVSYVADRLPSEWHRKIFYDNALTFFRWPNTELLKPRAPAVEVGVMKSEIV
jgi:predicted TIM-barrel fold metal-dependent hydrolase